MISFLFLKERKPELFSGLIINMHKDFYYSWLETLKSDNKEVRFYNDYCIFQCFVMTCVSISTGYYFVAMPFLILLGFFLLRHFKIKRYFEQRMLVVNGYIKENTSTTSEELH